MLNRAQNGPRNRSAAYAEVGVIGGGPAGARVAELLAANGREVVVWDPKAPWEKPCGGGLTAGLLTVAPEVRDVLPSARPVGRVVLATRDALVSIQLDRPIHVIARRDLGAWQLDRARAAGAAVEGSGVRAIARTADGWAITLRDGVMRTVRHLVGADGAASLVRSVAAPALKVALEPTRIVYPEAVGVGEAAVIVLRFSPGVEGYAWDFPRPGHHSVGAVVGPGTGGRQRLDAEIDALTDGGVLPPPPTLARRGAVIGSALYLRTGQYGGIGGADYALVGDAAGLADPATGEGITNAFRSGALAAEVFVRDRSFRRYPRVAAARFEAEFRTARWLRHLMYDRGWAVRLIAAASHRPRMAAAAAQLLNDANDHRSLTTMIVRVLGTLLRANVLARRLVEQPE
jgi:flavin-dependent dehydrogenase